MGDDAHDDPQPGAPTDPQTTARRLLDEQGRTFAEEAGIVLADEPDPLWQLLVLVQLLSARISGSVAIATARELFRVGWTSPTALRLSSWQQRVAVLGRGGYRRYDFSTATRLAENASVLRDRWSDDLRGLRDEAKGDPRGVGALLRCFTGIGPTGAAIYLREVQGVWPSVRPQVDALVLRGAAASGLPQEPAALAALVPEPDFPRLCAALVRTSKASRAPRTSRGSQ